MTKEQLSQLGKGTYGTETTKAKAEATQSEHRNAHSFWRGGHADELTILSAAA